MSESTWRKYSFDHWAFAVLGPDMRIGLELYAASAPASYQPAVVAVPGPAWIVSEYWVCHTAVAIFDRSIAIPFDVTSVPAASPDQPTKSSRVPGVTSTSREATMA